MSAPIVLLTRLTAGPKVIPKLDSLRSRIKDQLKYINLIVGNLDDLDNGMEPDMEVFVLESSSSEDMEDLRKVCRLNRRSLIFIHEELETFENVRKEILEFCRIRGMSLPEVKTYRNPGEIYYFFSYWSRAALPQA